MYIEIHEWPVLLIFSYVNQHLTICLFFLSESLKFYQINANVLQRLEHFGHRIANTPESKTRPCIYCKSMKIRTKSGHPALSRHKCSKCDIPLCTKNRNCFALFHINFMGEELAPAFQLDPGRWYIHLIVWEVLSFNFMWTIGI